MFAKSRNELSIDISFVADRGCKRDQRILSSGERSSDFQGNSRAARVSGALRDIPSPSSRARRHSIGGNRTLLVAVASQLVAHLVCRTTRKIVFKCMYMHFRNELHTILLNRQEIALVKNSHTEKKNV